MHFANALKTLLEARGISLRAFEKRTGLDHSTLNRLVNSQRPSPEQVALLCSKGCDTEIEMFALSAAHVKDEVAQTPVGKKLVSAYNPGGDPHPGLPDETRASLEVIARAAVDAPQLQKLIGGLAGMISGPPAANFADDAAAGALSRATQKKRSPGSRSPKPPKLD